MKIASFLKSTPAKAAPAALSARSAFARARRWLVSLPEGVGSSFLLPGGWRRMRFALALMTVLWGMAGASALHAQTAQAGATITAVSGISTSGVAVDRSGNLFIAGSSSSITEVLAVNGVVSPSSARRSVGSGFNQPAGVVVDANGNVFVADQFNQATKEIVASGGVVSSTSTVTTIYNDPGFPVKVALDSMGDVFVADADLTSE